MFAYILSLFLALYVPLEPVFNAWVPDDIYIYWISLPEFLILACGLLILFDRFYIRPPQGERVSFTHFLKLQYKEVGAMALFALWVVISTLLNWQSGVVALLGVRQILRFIGFAYLIHMAGLTKTHARTLLIVMMSMVLLQTSLGIAQVTLPESWTHFIQGRDERVAVSFAPPTFDINWLVGTRATGTLLRYDRLGVFLALGVIIFVAWERYILAGFVSIALLATYSRTAWIGTLCALIYILWVRHRAKEIKAIAVLIGMGILSLIIYAYMVPYPIRFIQESYRVTIPQRILQTFSRSELEVSSERFGRIFFWGATLGEIVQDNPLLGVGPGRYGGGAVSIGNNHAVYDEYNIPFGIENKGGQIDNNWLSLWGELGTIGLFLFIYLLYTLWSQAKKLYHGTRDIFFKKASVALRACIIAYSLFALFGPYFELKPSSYYFWMLGALTLTPYED